MDVAVHLPQVDFDGTGLSGRRLSAVVAAARELGYAGLSANDHLDFPRPWLDGLVALSRAAADAGELPLMTSVALPTVRGPVALAAALAAIARLSSGPIVAGVGPGSSAADHALVGSDFAARWGTFEAAASRLRQLLASPTDGPAAIATSPGPIPVWVASWGSPRGLRRVARSGDGWVASAYHGTPNGFGRNLRRLEDELTAAGRRAEAFPHALVTMWLWLGDRQREIDRVLTERLAPSLARDPEDLRGAVCVGTAPYALDLLSRYRAAGCHRVHIWPISDEPHQLERFATELLPQLSPEPTDA